MLCDGASCYLMVGWTLFRRRCRRRRKCALVASLRRANDGPPRSPTRSLPRSSLRLFLTLYMHWSWFQLLWISQFVLECLNLFFFSNLHLLTKFSLYLILCFNLALLSEWLSTLNFPYFENFLFVRTCLQKVMSICERRLLLIQSGERMQVFLLLWLEHGYAIVYLYNL